MKVRPLFDKVVVESLETEEKTVGGFILPAASQEKQQMAKVVAVGPGGVVDGKDVVMQVKVGDKILYSKYAGSEFKVDGKELVIINRFFPSSQTCGCCGYRNKEAKDLRFGSGSARNAGRSTTATSMRHRIFSKKGSGNGHSLPDTALSYTW